MSDSTKTVHGYTATVTVSEGTKTRIYVVSADSERMLEIKGAERAVKDGFSPFSTAIFRVIRRPGKEAK